METNKQLPEPFDRARYDAMKASLIEYALVRGLLPDSALQEARNTINRKQEI